MSRSYKHTPICGGKYKFAKNQANRKVRRNKMDLNVSHGGYKKVYCSWEICDFLSLCSWEEYWRREWDIYYYLFEHCPTSKWCKEPNYDECYRDWWRAYKMK